ncbi:hypothetical protein P7C70_g3390, partial [Phenoliferia sp. Uapishka_3]
MVDLNLKSGPSIDKSQSSTYSETTLEVAFSDSDLLKRTLDAHFRSGSSTAAGNFVDIEDLAPNATATQVAQLAGSRFARLGAGQSNGLSLAIVVASTMGTEEGVGDHSSAKILGFMERKIGEGASGISLVTPTFDPIHSTAFEHTAVNVFEMDVKPILELLSGEATSTSRATGISADFKNFKLIFKIQSQLWSDEIRSFTIAEVTKFASFLSLPGIQALAQAFPVFHDVLTGEPGRRLTELLSPYFLDVGGFVKLLVDNQALVTASTVLYAVQGKGECWEPGDLDIVTPQESGPRFYEYLTGQGWELDRHATMSKSYKYGYGTMSAYWVVYKKEGRSIDVGYPQPADISPMDFLFHSCLPEYFQHSTPVMAFFTGSIISHHFLPLTLNHKLRRARIGVGCTDSGTFAGVQKYRARGYEEVSGDRAADGADCEDVWSIAVEF